MDSIDFTDIPVPPPPRKGDALFRGDLPDWRNNACLNPTGHDAERGYTNGYRRGARVLADHVIEHQEDQDSLVYPIIFLYRHHIELALKSLILNAPSIIGRPLTPPESQHLGMHRLNLLWQDLKPMFSDVCKAAGWSKLAADDVDGVDSYIKQLSELDLESYSFRYARRKSGAPSLPTRLTHVNLRHFAEMLDRLANYLDGLDAGLSALIETERET